MTDSRLDLQISAVLAAPQPSAPADLWLGEEADSAPLKTSVTSLLLSGQTVHPAEYQPPEEEETVEVKRRPELPGFLLSETPPRPAFMEETQASAVDIGSLTHRFLRLVDLSVFRDIRPAEVPARVAEEVDRMRAHSILTASEAAAVYQRGAAAFLASDLGRRLIAAPRVEREWPFTMQLRPDAPTLVQGIVDAAFLENDRWILVDYKTDRDTRQGVFVPRHEKQMNWYRIAVQRLTGCPVAEMWLFALRAAKAYPVRRVDV